MQSARKRPVCEETEAGNSPVSKDTTHTTKGQHVCTAIFTRAIVCLQTEKDQANLPIWE